MLMRNNFLRFQILGLIFLQLAQSSNLTDITHNCIINSLHVMTTVQSVQNDPPTCDFESS